MTPPSPLLAGIEAGGTKVVCAVARGPLDVLREVRIPTTGPDETLDACLRFFRGAESEWGPLAALGIGTFGPAGVNPSAPDYGRILDTPKPGWRDFPMLEHLFSGLGRSLPVLFDTDVNAAAVGEAAHGAARGLDHAAYVTVGTGIGGGFLHHGVPLHGHSHPEIGHILVPELDPEPQKAVSACPFHPNCLEGRASGTAMRLRWGVPAETLPPEHPAWDLEARYLAHGAVALTAAWAPQRIIFGGGVVRQPGLLPALRRHFSDLSGSYWRLPPVEEYLCLAELDQKAGMAGALTMAAGLAGKPD